MSQHDFEIANQTFPAFRSDLNNALQALVSVSAGASAPTTTFAYQLWYDSTNDILKMRNAADDAWITLFTFNQGTNSVQVSGEELVDDTSPQLGGDLDVNGNKIISASNGNIELEPNGTGDIILDGDVGIGTTSPATSLDVVRNGTQPLRVQSTSGTEVAINMVNTGGNVQLEAHSGNFTIDADSVGIGTTSPSTYDSRANSLVVGGSGNAGITIFSGANQDGRIAFAESGDTGLDAGSFFYDHNDAKLRIATGGSDRMCIDGVKVGFGTTSPIVAGTGYTGINIDSNSSGTSLTLTNANNYNTYLFTSSSSASTELQVASGNFLIRANGALYTYDTAAFFATDDDRHLGKSNRRWDNVYATNGTIQTSDENEKQQIASLTSAEITAAKAISKLFKTFKWNSAVTKKGANARIHTGVIAQQVETAMTDAGLDASDYGFFTSDTWWEESVSVAAVAAETDDEGKVIVPAIDAHTRIDTYDTQAEAPAGAVERTRKGIRYPELLAFIGAATEQRLADIETRLTALESA